jgi:hypothetical protein
MGSHHHIYDSMGKCGEGWVCGGFFSFLFRRSFASSLISGILLLSLVQTQITGGLEKQNTL